MDWISVKEKLPLCDGNRKLSYSLAYHTIHGIGVAWFWGLEDHQRKELEEEFGDKYLCSAQFICNRLDGNYGIEDEDDIDIFEHSPHFKNLGTITHWMPLPQKPMSQ